VVSYYLREPNGGCRRRHGRLLEQYTSSRMVVRRRRRLPGLHDRSRFYHSRRDDNRVPPDGRASACPSHQRRFRGDVGHVQWRVTVDLAVGWGHAGPRGDHLPRTWPQLVL